MSENPESGPRKKDLSRNLLLDLLFDKVPILGSLEQRYREWLEFPASRAGGRILQVWGLFLVPSALSWGIVALLSFRKYPLEASLAGVYALLLGGGAYIMFKEGKKTVDSSKVKGVADSKGAENIDVVRTGLFNSSPDIDSSASGEKNTNAEDN